MYRRSGRGRVLLLAFVVLSIILITLDFRQGSGGPLGRVKDASAAVMAPIQRGINVVVRPVGDFFSAIGDLARLRRENERYKAEIGALRERVSVADSLIDENVRLRSIVALHESWAGMDRIAAEVVAKSPANYKWAVEIDKGREHGIRPDMPVLAPQGLVGKVISVLPNEATVLLLIDPQGAAGARIEGLGDTGIVSGNGPGEDLTMQFVDSDSEVEPGDLVYTSGQAPSGRGAIFPPGIPIGVVVDVGDDERALDKEIQVRPAVNFTGLQFVEVLLSSGRRSVGQAAGAGR